MQNLKVFENKEAVVDYVFTELLDTLDDDLSKMEFEEAYYYTDEDREHMRGRIHDIHVVYDALVNNQ